MALLSENTISATITKQAEKSVRNGHPWIYADSITRISREGEAGDIAVIYNQKREYTAIGIYDPSSPIRIRVLHRGRQTLIDEDWLKRRIEDSLSRRKNLMNDKLTNGFRLISGENDNLPGLTADIYDNVLVVKLDSKAWVVHLNLISEILKAILEPETIILRLSRTIEDTKDFYDGQLVFGKPVKGAVVFSENGILFEADPVNGQKTGFFLDQRENRARVMNLAKGRTVLNVFSYNGGFSLYASKGGAKSVISLDISREALDASIRNYKINEDIADADHSTMCCDAFDGMAELVKQGKKFGLVIVDPPSFARKQADIPNALKAYEKLASLAVSLTDRDGITVCASCSARVSTESFFEAVLKSVKKSGRKYKELERTFHAADHPVGFDEGAYLKCIYLKIS